MIGLLGAVPTWRAVGAIMRASALVAFVIEVVVGRLARRLVRHTVTPHIWNELPAPQREVDLSMDEDASVDVSGVEGTAFGETAFEPAGVEPEVDSDAAAEQRDGER